MTPADEILERLRIGGGKRTREPDWLTHDYTHPDYAVRTVEIDGERWYVSVSRA